MKRMKSERLNTDERKDLIFWTDKKLLQAYKFTCKVNGVVYYFSILYTDHMTSLDGFHYKVRCQSENKIINYKIINYMKYFKTHNSARRYYNRRILDTIEQCKKLTKKKKKRKEKSNEI